MAQPAPPSPAIPPPEVRAGAGGLPGTGSPPAPAPPPAPGKVVIQADHAGKKFGDLVAVDDLTFEIYQGEIFGFIGPSGSGKTTAMRLLNGIYTPTSGSVRLFGLDPARPTRHLHERFSYMPQQFVLYPNLTVYENIDFLAGVYGLGWQARRQRIRQMLDFVEIWDARNRLARDISGGMQRRLELAGALIHNPDLLFADEPTAGIDPVLRGKFWDEFRRLRETGRTIFVTTQYISESEYCDRVGVVRKGKLLAVATPLDLRRQVMQGDMVDVESPNLDAAKEILTTQPYVVQQADGKPLSSWVNEPAYHAALRVHVPNAGDAIPQMMQALQAANIPVTSAQEYRPSFDDVFIQLMGKAEEYD